MGYTSKQVRIILLMAEGHSSKEIAQQTGTTPHTIGNHRKRILRDSGCKNWCNFMAHYGRNGYLDGWAEKGHLYTPPQTEETDTAID